MFGDWVWWHVLVIPAFMRLRQEENRVKATLCYIEMMSSARAML